MLAFLLVTHIKGYVCGHDNYINQTNARYNKYLSMKSIRNGANWENMRIHIDYRYFDGTRKDELMCSRAGQDVYWDIWAVCAENDVINQTQIDAIKGTMENVKRYLSRLLKVIPLPEPIVIRNPEGTEQYNVDFHLTVVVRPFNARYTIAQCGVSEFEKTSRRPTVATMILNGKYAPTTVQDHDTLSCEFFYVCVHEIFHGLGINSGSIQSYHPQNDPNPFDEIKCSLKIKGKQTNFLVTPYARKYAMKRYGVERIYGDDSSSCPAGIELDDKWSHLHGKTFHSEVMNPVSTTPKEGPMERVTDASMAVLLDTGNYKVDFKMVRPLIWGNPESINGNSIPNFIRGIWQTDYPENYYYNPDKIDYTSFDYKSYGSSSMIDAFKCPSDRSFDPSLL